MLRWSFPQVSTTRAICVASGTGSYNYNCNRTCIYEVAHRHGRDIKVPELPKVRIELIDGRNRASSALNHLSSGASVLIMSRAGQRTTTSCQRRSPSSALKSSFPPKNPGLGLTKIRLIFQE